MRKCANWGRTAQQGASAAKSTIDSNCHQPGPQLGRYLSLCLSYSHCKRSSLSPLFVDRETVRHVADRWCQYDHVQALFHSVRRSKRGQIDRRSMNSFDACHSSGTALAGAARVSAVLLRLTVARVPAGQQGAEPTRGNRRGTPEKARSFRGTRACTIGHVLPITKCREMSWCR
jgi:hypothetical protein